MGCCISSPAAAELCCYLRGIVTAVWQWDLSAGCLRTDADDWFVPNPEESDECQVKVVQLRYRWGKSNGKKSKVEGVMNVKARMWSAKRMGRLASELGIPSHPVLHHGRTTVPAVASLCRFSISCSCLFVFNLYQAVHQASDCAL